LNEPGISALHITGGTYLLIGHLTPVVSDTSRGDQESDQPSSQRVLEEPQAT